MSFVRSVQGLFFNIVMWVVVDLMVLAKMKNDYLSSIWLVYQIIYIALAFGQMGSLCYLWKKLIDNKDQNIANSIIIDNDNKKEQEHQFD